jgi:hypothetical protein
MKLPSDTPRLPKWAFVLGWAGLMCAAWVIWYFAARPITGVALVSVVVCVNVAAVVIVIPFITDYFAASEEAMDNRQRSLQALSVTISSAAEQVSIAATGLQGIAEAAQDNYGKFEQLSKTVEARIAEMESRLASAAKDDGEAAVKYEAAARKVAKAAADFESGAAKAASASEAARSAAADLEAAAARASAAAGSARMAPQKAAEPPHAEQPPVPADRIAQVRPAVRKSEHPFDGEPDEAPRPGAAPAISRAAAALSEAPEEGAPAAAEPPPPATESAPPAAEPAPTPTPRKRAPRKPAPEQAPPPPEELTLEAPPQPEPAAAAEPAVSADGATRLVVTAYIGIGNRLFIRGEGPGLSWEKGVPLSFVSIGKWRWETNDASGAVRFKLYKNDEAECTSLGERSIDPGAQQELTASF